MFPTQLPSLSGSVYHLNRSEWHQPLNFSTLFPLKYLNSLYLDPTFHTNINECHFKWKRFQSFAQPQNYRQICDMTLEVYSSPFMKSLKFSFILKSIPHLFEPSPLHSGSSPCPITKRVLVLLQVDFFLKSWKEGENNASFFSLPNDSNISSCVWLRRPLNSCSHCPRQASL